MIGESTTHLNTSFVNNKASNYFFLSIASIDCIVNFLAVYLEQDEVHVSIRSLKGMFYTI